MQLSARRPQILAGLSSLKARWLGQVAGIKPVQCRTSHRTQEHERQPQVLRQLLSGLTASLRFLSGGRPPGMKASFRFSAGSGEGRAGVATRNRSFETWALSITKTPFLQRRLNFLSPRPTACCADRERYQLRFLQVLTSHRARSRQPQVLSGPDHKAA